MSLNCLSKHLSKVEKIMDVIAWLLLPAIKESSDYTDFLVKKSVDAHWERVFTLDSKDVLDLKIEKTSEEGKISWDDFKRAFLWKHLDYLPAKREAYLHKLLNLSQDENYYWYNLITSDDYPYASVALTILLDQK